MSTRSQTYQSGTEKSSKPVMLKLNTSKSRKISVAEKGSSSRRALDDKLEKGSSKKLKNKSVSEKTIKKRSSKKEIEKASSQKSLKKPPSKSLSKRLTPSESGTKVVSISSINESDTVNFNQCYDVPLKNRPSFIQRFVSVARIKAQVRGPAESAIELLKITQKDLDSLKVRFDLYDDDGSGSLEILEFLKVLDVEKTNYTDAVFALVDSDGSGEIDFNEFVQVLTTYCIYSQVDILQFAFSFFDKDGSGTLDEREVIDMCVAITPKPIFPGNIQNLFETFDVNDDGLIDFDEFQMIHKRYPMLFFPAFHLQDMLQKKTLGAKRWTTILRNKARREFVEDYKLTHDGALPPAEKHGCFKFLKS